MPENKQRELILPPPRSTVNVGLEEDTLPVIDLDNFPTLEDERELGHIIVVGLKDYVFDVTALAEYLGPNKQFSNYPSKDISYALTKYSNLPEDVAVKGYANLSEAELDVLNSWVSLFKARFKIIGKIEVSNGDLN
ncbi:hypothetical protein B0H11DRAFT_2185180 [Mycena galericulata]|nr:hypothetical protein B0H11DRAFT_2208965 [Mycena galericulata]KAJ7442386.1 hypothetical protein B0H11DRAFT_2292108 [Mycena galericulata]KAJ7448860.1 hypothetical protein B0H11DRAFT_2289666 [Mycena galericulata]KAJ7491578.1 hypothetical protein B0H11DRAFT_2277792 [Mycena galericulata]KAJ7502336.1 hypothetical protein B0H11DRAFT_2188543 [Mycena galericulata]